MSNNKIEKRKSKLIGDSNEIQRRNSQETTLKVASNFVIERDG
jgi:hypothetical protein